MIVFTTANAYKSNPMLFDSWRKGSIIKTSFYLWLKHRSFFETNLLFNQKRGRHELKSTKPFDTGWCFFKNQSKLYFRFCFIWYKSLIVWRWCKLTYDFLSFFLVSSAAKMSYYIHPVPTSFSLALVVCSVPQSSFLILCHLLFLRDHSFCGFDNGSEMNSLGLISEHFHGSSILGFLLQLVQEFCQLLLHEFE